MKTATPRSTSALPQTTRPTSVRSVTFHDGMIVTAEDLDAAQQYPASMLQIVLRAFFGAGVVCGLGLRRKKTGGWLVCVDPGVAIDCEGHPIELCRPVQLDLSPDPCDCEDPPESVCIAIRRITSDEAPKDPCGCDTDDPRFDCRRVRDHVLIRAFTDAELDALPDVCARPGSQKLGDETSGAEKSSDGKQETPDPCEALTTCTSCAGGECWILLGCVSLDKDNGITAVNTDRRKWVKPVEALCANLFDRITEMERRLDDLGGEVPGSAPVKA